MQRLAVILMLALVGPTWGHDSWINRGGFRNGAGEWCCGANDCEMLPGRQVTERRDGYRVVFLTGAGEGEVAIEVVPYAEAQPSPDGKFWRCKRPDGTRRCFFAPPPSM